ncbi:polynucleotide adenylyltransferase [Streptomyces globosus]|uniref:Polynucleotide adenylyltransferase n=1 Tax=Streptomyces globosus TaxID=68209 RepID=A0A344U9M4_9ACTN|nr:poly(A) polymerase [Streptomyces globosus]AXE27595.1 polynucleotide adenylyltransferase [Streptomyces globosus]
MRTSEQLYHQVRWDPRFDPARFVMGLHQRGAPPKRVPLPSFVPGGDIPWHRVLFVEADGELVWDRATGTDRIDSTTAGRVRDPRLLRAPAFAARTPYVWDPARPGAAGGAWRAAEEAGAGAVRRPTASAASPVSVRLLTWNTLWDRYDAPRIDTARRRPLLCAELEAADADVIALQEVEPALLDMLLEQPWVRRAYTVSAAPDGRDVSDFGLLVLSRLPVAEAGLHRLGPHKAVSAVTVRTAAGPLVVACVHLTSDHTQDGAARRAEELARVAEGLGAVDAHVALVGDFNDGRGGADGPAAVLGMRDAWSEVHGASDDTPTFDPSANPLAAVGSLSGRAARLDRVLLRSDAARVRRAALRGDVPEGGGLFPSDHYGVEVEVEVRVGAGGGGGGAVRVEGSGARAGAPTSRTAVAWLPPYDPAVTALRREHDPAFGRWPAHVNLLFGFVPEASFEEAVPLLAEAAAATAPFPVRMAGVYDFGHRDDAALWLDPAAAGEAPWQELRQALTAQFPACRGRGGGFTPHLTLGRNADPQRALAEFTARLGGPGAGRDARVEELAVLSRRGDEPMRVRATVQLGTGRVRWLPEPGAARDGEPQRRDGVEGDASVAGRVADRVAGALAGGVVHLVGSRRTGCALPGADLDLVAALPGAPDIEAVRERVAEALPGARRLRVVTGARVPGLRLHVDGLDVDVVVVGTGGIRPEEAVARRAELGEAAAVALSAVSDAEAVCAAAAEGGPERQAAFAELARQVKAWAGARGVDSAPFGGVPGVAWAVMAARTVREAPELRGASLLRAFFAAWAAWDWREPVALTGAGGAGPSAVPGGGGGAVAVLTPSEPVRSCTAQVGPGMRDLLTQELYRAWELLEADPAGVAELCAVPALHRRHAAWAVVTVRGGTPRECEEALGRARGRMRALVGALEDIGGGGGAGVHAWPRPLDSSGGVVRYAVGLGAAPPDRARLEEAASRWCAALPGVSVEWAEGGDIPTVG